MRVVLRRVESAERGLLPLAVGLVPAAGDARAREVRREARFVDARGVEDLCAARAGGAIEDARLVPRADPRSVSRPNEAHFSF